MKPENRIYSVTYHNGKKEKIIGAQNLPPQSQVRSIRLVKEKQAIPITKTSSARLAERKYIVKQHDGTETVVIGFHNLPEAKSVASIHRIHEKHQQEVSETSEYLCFADFEYTCGGRSNDIYFDITYGQEILSVGLVVALRNSGEIIDTFYQTIRPTHNTTLTTFCKTLTGLSQEDIDQSASFEAVMRQAITFCKQYDFTHIYAFGNTDRQTLLKNQKRHQAVPGLTTFIAQIQSVDAMLSQLLFHSTLPISLENLKQICNMNQPVRHHALADAKDLCAVWFCISNGNYNQALAQQYQTERITKAEYYRNRQFLSVQTAIQSHAEETIPKHVKEDAISSALKVIAYLKANNIAQPFISDIKLSAFCDDLLTLLGAPESYYSVQKNRKERGDSC